MIYYASSNTMPIEYKGYIFYVKYDAEEVEGEEVGKVRGMWQIGEDVCRL